MPRGRSYSGGQSSSNVVLTPSSTTVPAGSFFSVSANVAKGTTGGPNIWSLVDPAGTAQFNNTGCLAPEVCGWYAPSMPGRYTVKWTMGADTKTVAVNVVAGSTTSSSTTTAAPTTTSTTTAPPTTTSTTTSTTTRPTTTTTTTTTTRPTTTSTTTRPLVRPTTQPPPNLGTCKPFADIKAGENFYACDRLTVFGKKDFKEYNFSIPKGGNYTSRSQIDSIPGNNGKYTIYGGDIGNVSFVFPPLPTDPNKIWLLTITDGDNFTGVKYQFVETCGQAMSDGSCGQMTPNKAWTHAKSIRLEEVDPRTVDRNTLTPEMQRRFGRTVSGGRRRRTQRSKRGRGSRRH